MKRIALVLILLPFYAQASERGALCSAELEFLDGSRQTAIMECDNFFAGKCLQEVELKDGSRDWQEVSCQ